MKYFLAWLLVATTWLTLLESYSVTLFILVVGVCLVVVVWQYRQVLTFLGGAVVARIAVWIHLSMVVWSPRSTGVVEWRVSELLPNHRFVLTSWSYSILVYSDVDVSYGELVLVWGRIQPTQTIQPTWSTDLQLPAIRVGEFSYDHWLTMKGFDATVWPSAVVKRGYQPNWFDRLRDQLRERIKQVFDAPKHQALVLGLLTGDRSWFTTSDYQLFLDSGLVHLVAVSGGNILYVMLLLQVIFFFIPFYPRVVVVWGWVIVYALLCGSDSSVWRAAIMGVIGLMAVLAGRSVDAWRLLSFAAIGLLVWNPYLLRYDLGFILSFVAVIGILVVSQYTQRTWLLSQYLIPVWWATIWVLPVLLFFVDTYNLTSIIANALLAPLAGLLMLWGAISLVTPTWISRGMTALYDLVYFLVEWSVRYGLTLSIWSQRSKFLRIVVWYWLRRQILSSIQNRSTWESHM